MKKFCSFLILSAITFNTYSQVIISSAGVAITENFNSLANTGSSSALPAGWAFAESGSGGNATYSADAGAGTAGNTYSYGTAANTERGFGGLQSGTVIPTIGVSYINNTGTALTSMTISYTGEQWRLGTAGRADRLDFQYSTDATSLTTGTWTPVAALNFSSPFTITAGVLNGNASANQAFVSGTVTSLNIGTNAVIWFRWVDFNASGADDGLAIDDFSATFNGSGSVVCPEPSTQGTTLTFPVVTASSINGSFTATTADGYLVVRSASASLSAMPADGFAYASGTALGGGIVVTSGTAVTFTDNGLSANTAYFYFVFSYNNTSCSGGPNYNAASPLTGTATTASAAPCATPLPPANLNLAAANAFTSGSFTSAGAGKYLVIISTSSSLSSGLLNGMEYFPGDVIGNGTVVSYGTATSFTATALAPGTTYYFYVFSANTSCSGEPAYSTTAITGNISTTNNSNGIPPGYYNSVAGLSCGPLKNALNNITMNGQITLGYGALDDVYFPTTDTIRNDAGTAPIIWDIYTNNNSGPEPFVFNSSQTTPGGFCGNSSPASEGTCWNKEHTFPKSFFNLGGGTFEMPTYADLFIVRPADGKINSNRANLPYSTVSTPSYSFPATSTTYPGVPVLDKIGPSTGGGFTVTAFEPADGVKGDIARAYFYIVTRYQNSVGNWVTLNTANSDAELVLDGTSNGGTYPSLLLPYLSMMIGWHTLDPVDVKESNRNDLVYSQQNNRNPYVDHPEYVARVFSCTGVVPVTLVDFTAEKFKANVLLKWYATYEAAFRQYDVERSVDGVSFNKIGEVRGQNLADYSFIDYTLPNKSVIYYRLKMIDLDGRSHYSKIIFVKLKNNPAAAIVYPNPTAGDLNIKLEEGLKVNSQIQIIDITGRIVQKLNVPVNAVSMKADVHHLPAGKYFIKIMSDKQVINGSFTVIK